MVFSFFLSLGLFFVTSLSAAPNVVVSIPPVHSLAASIMAGVAEPTLLLKGVQSPHDADLKPSQRAQLEAADLIIWVGPGLENFLEKPLNALRAVKKICTLLTAAHVAVKPVRVWPAAGEENAAPLQPEHRATHSHVHTHHVPEEDTSHKGCHHEGPDPHIWLDLENAVAIVDEITFYLSAVDVEHAPTYEANAQKVKQRLAQLKKDLGSGPATAEPKSYIAMHDGFQYVEELVGFTCATVLSLHHDLAPSLKKIAGIKDLIKSDGVCCIFTEPQWASTLPQKLATEAHLCYGELDPLGANLTPGPDLYFQLMTMLVSAFRKCTKNVLPTKAKA